MQLLCNGVLLDLKQGAALSFKKSNILFAFDSVECERSVSFDLPDTPNNEKVLGFAKDPAYKGTAMRQKLSAEMYCGLVIKQGYLHVDSFSGGMYKAVFVTGDLVGLQAIRDAGGVVEIYKGLAVKVDYNTDIVAPNSTSIVQRLANIRHMSEDGKVRPSVWLRKMITDVLDSIGAAYDLPTDYRRVIIAEPTAFQERSGTFRRFVGNNHVEGAEWADMSMGSTDDDAQISLLFDRVQVPITWNVVDEGGMIIDTITGTVECFSARQNIKMAFEASLPNDIFLSYSTDTPNPVILSGTEIEIEKNRPFFFYRNAEFITYPNYGYSFTQTFNVPARVWAASNDLEDGDVLLLADNAPDVTVITLLKAMAALHGQVLTYENGVIKFDTLNFQAVVDYTDRLISIKKTTRTFGGYAQQNELTFSDGDGSLPSEREPIFYTVPNENIEEHNTLLEIPFSQGGISTVNRLYVFLREGSEDVLADADTYQSTYALCRARLRKNVSLQAMCTLSTSIDVSVWMTLQEWENLTPKTLVQIRGKRYVWTSGTWSKGVATLSLSQI